MKIMDNSGQDECTILDVTPSKKKKMIQAQLPFQMRSPIDLPKSVKNKKRKLTSPSIEHKSPKVVKISKDDSHKADVYEKQSVSNALKESEKPAEVIYDVETEHVKENKVSNAVTPVENKKERSSIGKRKTEEANKVRSSPLARFLTKSDKETDNSEDNDQSSLKEGKNESLKKNSNRETEDMDQDLECTLSDKAEDASMKEENSIHQYSDSDIEVLSSDAEEKDEQENFEDTLDKSMENLSPSTCKTPKQDRIKQRKLTPKQQEKELLIAKKKEERRKLKMEKEKRLEEEREKKLKEKEQKMMEKKMRDLKKQMEIEQKQKEKQAKEDERKKREEAKEEEKRKKEEEKLEAERKKQKAASNFTSFFVAKKQEKSVDEEDNVETKNFMPFQVKADMKVAPVTRRVLNDKEKLSLDEKCNAGNSKVSNLYLKKIKNKKFIVRKSTKTWPLEMKQDVIILDEENDGTSNIVTQKIDLEKQRIKLLQFTENRRPPYWGTWRKRSRSINPRKPFAKDSDWFNYEIDSDEEWEEEEPGESLHGSDDEKDEDNAEENEYDVDNEFMVPHGYLSDEEVGTIEEDGEDMSPETQKDKLKLLGEQFEIERKAKTAKLRPKIIGCIWRGLENTFSESVPQKTRDFLSSREAWVRQIPVTLPAASESESATECRLPTPSQSTHGSRKTQFPEEAVPDLIRMLHGCSYGKKFMAKEFLTYWSRRNNANENPISTNSLVKKISKIGKWKACPDEGPMRSKFCWYVSKETRKEYNLEDLDVQNRWTYCLQPKRKTNFGEPIEKEDKEKKEEKKSVPLITQFTKKISQEEMKKQLGASPTQSPKTKSVQKSPKRATLISVARGEQFAKTSKDSLLKHITPNKTENKDLNNTNDNSNDSVIIEYSNNDQAADQKTNKKNKSSSSRKKQDS